MTRWSWTARTVSPRRWGFRRQQSHALMQVAHDTLESAEMRKTGLRWRLLLAATPAEARTILFVGNSFTFGANSAVHYYKPDTVTDLNGPGANGKTVGGVPAFFKAFTKEAGLDYTCQPGDRGRQGAGSPLAEKRALIDKPWDVVVMHGYSTLDKDHPGNPALLVSSTKTDYRHAARQESPRRTSG